MPVDRCPQCWYYSTLHRACPRGKDFLPRLYYFSQQEMTPSGLGGLMQPILQARRNHCQPGAGHTWPELPHRTDNFDFAVGGEAARFAYFGALLAVGMATLSDLYVCIGGRHHAAVDRIPVDAAVRARGCSANKAQRGRRDTCAAFI